MPVALGRRALLGIVISCAAVSGLWAEEAAIDGRKQARAAQLAVGSIRLDGRLDDDAWQLAAPITEFVQAEPIEGRQPGRLRRAVRSFALSDGDFNLRSFQSNVVLRGEWR